VHYDVVLVNPPLRGITGYEHIGLEYIASFLRKNGISVKVIDPRLQKISPAKAVSDILDWNPKIVGVSIPFQDYVFDSIRFITQMRKFGIKCHISVGGIFPSFAYRELLETFPQINSVVLGEGEKTFTQLAQNVLQQRDWHQTPCIAYSSDGETKSNEIKPTLTDLDLVPFPSRDLLPFALKTLGYAAIVSSRGCFGRCNFCSVVPFFSLSGNKLKMRSAENVVEEITYLVKEHGVQFLAFNDANFLCSRERAEEIARLLIRKNLKIRYSIECRADSVERGLFKLLKESGLRKVFLGVESGSQSMLDRLKKDTTVEDNLRAVDILSELNIYTRLGFIMFDDRTSIEEVEESLAFLRKVKRKMPKGKLKGVSITARLLPLAGTEFEQYLKVSKKYLGSTFNYDYKIDDPMVRFLYRVNRFFYVSSTGFLSFLHLANRWENRWLKEN